MKCQRPALLILPGANRETGGASLFQLKAGRFIAIFLFKKHNFFPRGKENQNGSLAGTALSFPMKSLVMGGGKMLRVPNPSVLDSLAESPCRLQARRGLLRKQLDFKYRHLTPASAGGRDWFHSSGVRGQNVFVQWITFV